MADLAAALAEAIGEQNVATGDQISEDYSHDEALTARAQLPAVLVKPGSTDDVRAIVALAREHRAPLTARGSGTGLCGSCIPREGGVLVSFERMNEILEIDTQNHVAVVQPGVTLDELDKATAQHGFVYPVYPGENSASLGGNVATNAGGLRAVKYGVTRHQVLGLTAVLGTGEVIRTGGRFVKATTGYDLTQLIIGSEGTLALATEATLKLYPRPDFATTLLAPFSTLGEITAIVPTIIASGVAPLILEYIDLFAMGGILNNAGLDLGIPQEIKDTALAYLVVVLEDRRSDRLEENVQEMATLISEHGALDVYVLPPQAGVQLIHARERAFWSAKAAGAHDIIDMVVPRAAIPSYMAKVNELAQAGGSFITGCGHVGDGNVHLSVFQADEGKRKALIRDIFRSGMELGGAISGEHGIGTEKKPYYLELEQPPKLELMRRIKAAFDPDDILNPGIIFD
jgi:glycolate dehydrogenase FAD-linked subunit